MPAQNAPSGVLRIAMPVAVAMVAFAANSVLNRMAVDGAGMDPRAFATIRVLAGALALVVLVRIRGGRLPLRAPRRMIGTAALALYMIGFSLAYITLAAGVGALILFGTVQMTMFLFTALSGRPPSTHQIAGAAVAFAGLSWILWPSEGWSANPTGAAYMVAAGVGWGAYSIAGRGEPDALAATAANFLLCLPLVLLVALVSGASISGTPTGIGLAVVSGAVTSGLGYALWYRVLPQIAAATAAVVQLSVPVIALAGGMALLGESSSVRFLVGAGLVLGGIALSLRRHGAG